MKNGDARPRVTSGGCAAIGHYRSQVPLITIVSKTSYLRQLIGQTIRSVDLYYYNNIKNRSSVGK